MLNNVILNHCVGANVSHPTPMAQYLLPRFRLTLQCSYPPFSRALAHCSCASVSRVMFVSVVEDVAVTLPRPTGVMLRFPLLETLFRLDAVHGNA